MEGGIKKNATQKIIIDYKKKKQQLKEWGPNLTKQKIER